MRTMRASRTTAMLDLLHSQNSRSSIGSSRKSSTTTTTLVLSSIFLLFSLLIQSTNQTVFSKSRSPSATAEAATPTVIPLKKHFWHHESLYPLTSNDKKNFLFLNTTFITYTANISFTLKQQQQQQQQNVEQELDEESQSSSLTRSSSSSSSEMEVKNQPFVLDTTSSFSFVYCCDSPVIKNQTTTTTTTATPTGSNKDEVFCVQSSNCQKFECPDKNCYDHYRSTHYLPVVNQLEPGKSEKKKKNDPKVWYDVTNVPYTLVDGYRLVQDDISPTTLLVQYENGGDNGTVVGEQHRVGELNTVYTESPLLEGTRGVLGMAFSFFDFSMQQYVKKLLESSSSPSTTVLVALDLYSQEQYAIMNSVGDDGKMIFGSEAIEEYLTKFSSSGDNNIFKSGDSASASSSTTPPMIVWSERQYAVNSLIETKYSLLKNRYNQAPIQHQIPLYSLSMCLNGINLFANYTAHWHAKMATNMVGLGLPSPFYRMVMQWIKDGNNVTKSFSEWTTDEKYQLPDLFFTVHQFDSVARGDSAVLRIPLYTLFEDDQFHLYDLGDIWQLDDIGVLSTDPVIHFGVKVMQQLFTVIDYTNYRVGFVQKRLRSKSEQDRIDRLQSSYCASVSKQETCKGEQEFYSPSNRCLDPECNLYFLQTVDPKTGKCKLKASFYVLFFFLIGICLLLEVVLYEVYNRVIRELYSRAASNNAALSGAIN